MADNNQPVPTGVQQRPARTITLGPRTGPFTHAPNLGPTLASIPPPANLSSGNQAQSRTLILAFDGTSNLFDETNTNVVKLFQLLEKNRPDQQLLYYQPGIGTYAANPAIWTPISSKVAKMVDLGTAVYLDAHICAGYRFLVDNYQAGDKICLFGFSRGAYTARCLAGMLTKVGLLGKGNKEQIPFAYQIYKKRPNEKKAKELASRRAANFKKTFCRDVTVEFVGVWDTVSSVGVLFSRHLPFAANNDGIKWFRHALALDERRAKFKANVWHRSIKVKAGRVDSRNPLTRWLHSDPEHASPIAEEPATTQAPNQQLNEKVPLETANREPGVTKEPSGMAPTERKAIEKIEKEGAGGEKPTSRASRLFTRAGVRLPFSGTKKAVRHRKSTDGPEEFTDISSPTDTSYEHSFNDVGGLRVEEVWFAGCHADVGGGSVEDEQDNSLAGPSLRWMVREIAKANAGILFDQDALKNVDISLTTGASSIKSQYTPQMIPTLKEIEKEKEKEKLKPKGSISSANEKESPKSANYSSVDTDPDHKVTKYIEREWLDARSKMYDQLDRVPAWWILEYWPIQLHYQDDHGVWHTRWRFNRSKGRKISGGDKTNGGGKIKMHVSVQMRIDAGDYKPKAKYDEDNVEWVE